MTRGLLWLAFVSLLSLSCSQSAEPPYVHEPKYSKNVSTLFAFETEPSGDGVTPDFTWKDSTGALRSLKDLRGKVVLVNFWATWCAPCLVETPALRDIAKDFRDQGAVVIGVAIDQAGAVYPKVEEFAHSKNLGYQVITDPMLDVYKAYTGTTEKAIPVTYVIDADGLLYTVLIGEKQYDTFAETIRDILP